MHIHFGSTFGFENVYPLLVDDGQALHGHQYLGSKGFLEFLELHLGLVQRDVPDAIRIMHYKKCLQKMDASGKYNDLYIWASFENDDWNAAARLLQWRDELVLAQYKFDCSNIDLERLLALSKIENELEGELPPGVNDRWIKVLTKIKQRKNIWKNELTVYEPIKYMHPYFISLFDALEKIGFKIEEKEWKYNLNSKSDLGKIQQKFNNPKVKSDNALELNGDGSISILTGDNEQLIAESLGLHFSEQGYDDTVLIISERGEVLEDAFTKRDIPSMGYVSTLENGSLDQLFTLISLFLWKPFDPMRLIQFLTLSKTPLNNKLKRGLSKAFAKKQGVDNEEWEKALKKNLGLLSAKDNKVQRELYTALFEREKYFDIEKGAPSKAIIELYGLLRDWCLKKMKTPSEEQRRLHDRLRKKCESLISLVQLSSADNEKLITNKQIKRWQESIHDQDMLKSSIAEGGHPFYVKHPANLCKKASNIVWWNFIDQGNPLSRYNDWNTSEKKALINTPVYKKDSIISSWYWKLKQAILMADEKLILCVPKKKRGVKTEANPLLNDFKAWVSNLEVITQEVDILKDAIVVDQKEYPFETIPISNLPQNQTHYNLDKDKLMQFKRHGKESYSSLDKLIHHPHQYMMNYLLGIKPNPIPEISISSLIKGNVAHKLVEDNFTNEANLKMNDSNFEKLLSDHLEKLIEKEASVFLLKRNKIVFNSFRPKVIKSLVNLKNLIHSNDWKVFETELKLELNGDFELQGYIDLILKKDKEFLIVDLKWGRSDDRKKEVLNKEDLQLVMYYYLLKRKYPNSKINLAYYIISDGLLISRTENLFEKVKNYSVDQDELEIRNDIWTKFKNSIELRRQEFENGMVESGEGMKADDLESHLWHDETGFLPMKSKGKGDKRIKLEDIYSNYKKISGQ